MGGGREVRCVILKSYTVYPANDESVSNHFKCLTAKDRSAASVVLCCIAGTGKSMDRLLAASRVGESRMEREYFCTRSKLR